MATTGIMYDRGLKDDQIYYYAIRGAVSLALP